MKLFLCFLEKLIRTSTIVRGALGILVLMDLQITAPEIKNAFFTHFGFSLDHEAGLYRLFEKAGVARPT